MRFGIVGTNFVSEMFLKGAQDVPEVEAFGVTSGHYENAVAFGKKHNISHIYQNLDEMLVDDRIDVVYLGTPNAMHYAMTKQCILAKKNVMTEKPFCVTRKEAEELYSLAEEKHVYVHDAIVPLYTAHYQAVKDALGRIGTIRHVSFDFSKYSSRYDAYRAGKNPTTFRKELCNSAFMDLGIYCIADIVGLFGKPKEILAHSVKLDTGVDGASYALFAYNGFDAMVSVSKITDGRNISTIEGEEGTIFIEQPGVIQKAWLVDRKSKETTVLTDDYANQFGDQLRDLVKNAAEEKKESEKVPHALSLDVIETLEQTRRAAGIVYEGRDC